MSKNAYRKRDETKAEIVRILESGIEYTTWEIARKLGIAPSSHLRTILCEMFGKGEISGYRKAPHMRRTFVWFIRQSQELPGFQQNAT